MISDGKLAIYLSEDALYVTNDFSLATFKIPSFFVPLTFSGLMMMCIMRLSVNIFVFFCTWRYWSPWMFIFQSIQFGELWPFFLQKFSLPLFPLPLKLPQPDPQTSYFSLTYIYVHWVFCLLSLLLKISSEDFISVIVLATPEFLFGSLKKIISGSLLIFYICWDFVPSFPQFIFFMVSFMSLIICKTVVSNSLCIKSNCPQRQFLLIYLFFSVFIPNFLVYFHPCFFFFLVKIWNVWYYNMIILEIRFFPSQ